VQALCDSKNARIEALEAENKILAEEVMAWRNHDDLHECLTNTDYQQRVNVQTHDRACEAAQRTDNSGALIRAKETNQ
jgi:D-ribose pyranose/furanose isomerase RbsD